MMTTDERIYFRSARKYLLKARGKARIIQTHTEDLELDAYANNVVLYLNSLIDDITDKLGDRVIARIQP